MRALITGAQGQLGRAFVRRLDGHEVCATSRAELDITNEDSVRSAVKDYAPDVVINCAAYTDVDGAESHVETAMRVNGNAIRNLAHACKEAGTTLVQFSTDYVFDGESPLAYKTTAAPRPLNTYGRSKLMGEQIALQLLSRVYVVRTAWLYGVGGRNFVEKMLELGANGKQVRVVTDQRGAPTFADDVAGATLDLIQTKRYGVYHVTNQGHTTWYDFARRIFGVAGMTVDVRPISSDELSRPARRPRNSVLDLSALAEAIGYQPPPWEDALKRYIALRKAVTA